jgi:putative phosphoesterase
VRIAVLADTHLDGEVAGRLPPRALAVIGSADLVLHAGDLVTDRAHRQLAALAGGPLHAVLGNNDRGLERLPTELALELEGVPVALVHDSGRRQGRPRRLARRFPVARLVVFGHSHVPCDEVGVHGQRLFNPGSPTQRRSQPRPSMGLVTICAGELLTELISL